MGKFFKSAAVAAVLAMGVSGASANTVTLSQQDNSDVFAGGGSATVRVTANGVVSNLRVRAGGFRVSDGINDFIAFCASLADTLSLPGEYTARPFENPPLSYTQTVIDRVQALFNTAYATLDLSNDAQSGGFQLALWNLLYDTNDTVSSGTFRWTGSATSATALAARDQANAFLEGLDGPVTQVYTLTFWEAATDPYGKPLSQNLITAAPIPLPAAAWMLLAALGAAAAVSRRRRDA